MQKDEFEQAETFFEKQNDFTSAVTSRSTNRKNIG
jgi:hypothetical protein